MVRDMDMELGTMQAEERLGLGVQNWSLELEFSQPNSSLRDRPGWCLIMVSWPDIFNFINLILLINLTLYLCFNIYSIFWGFGVFTRLKNQLKHEINSTQKLIMKNTGNLQYINLEKYACRKNAKIKYIKAQKI